MNNRERIELITKKIDQFKTERKYIINHGNQYRTTKIVDKTNLEFDLMGFFKNQFMQDGIGANSLRSFIHRAMREYDYRGWCHE